jgi:hypothetical protein
MIAATLLAATLCVPGPVALHADSLEAVYRGGRTWHEFYEAVDARHALWVRNWSRAEVPADLLARARSAGPWRILVIAEARCSDSVNSVPYIAKLAERIPGLELRVIDSTVGRPWLEAHRTPDGRAATPTVLVLDDTFRIRACWVEQPAALQALWLPIVARGEGSANMSMKMDWYAEDEGREVLREIVSLLEAAEGGRTICPGTG